MDCLTKVEQCEEIRIIERNMMVIFPNIEIMLDDIDFYFLPKKLDTRLNEGIYFLYQWSRWEEVSLLDLFSMKGLTDG